MKIQIVTFAGVPGHIYDAEKHFHTEKLILILSDENKDETNKANEEFILNIIEITQFYEKLNVPVMKVYVNYKNFIEMTFRLANLLREFQEGDEILLNLSGGRRSMPISLIYAGTFISNFKDINIKCVVIPEDKTYEPFNLLPNYLPDSIDVKLMSKLSEKKPLTELEEFLGIKQPTISMRLKRLEKYKYIILNVRERNLTDLGRMVVDINISRLNNIKEKN
ncbi:hypothetical protein ES703_47275 [subsurface metagenome]